MEVVTSYCVEILNFKNAAKKTINIYRSAVSFLVSVVDLNWSFISSLEFSNEKQSYIDKLIHNTKNNKAIYNFDQLFPKMPSYLRRAAISVAIGVVSSYKSNYENWLNSNQKKSPPRLNAETHLMPCFYKDNMFIGDLSSDTAFIKLFVNNDWIWYPIKLKHTDMQYLRKYWSEVNCSAPTLEKKHHKWFLRFAFVSKVKLSDTPIENRRILAVDLGINTDAVCSIMSSDGTILLRKFINFKSDKDYIYHELNRLKKFQREHGSNNVGSRWSSIKLHNIEHGRKVGKAIAELAICYNCDVIVFEYLDFNGKIKGSKKERIHLWRKRAIQKVAETRAHLYGIRISRVCAWGTSKLAYDGSGVVKRDENNYSLCTFTTGKRYNCDLSASYNIGARYLIREKLKPLSEKRRSHILAKVPECEHRTSCTYNSLLKLNREL